MKLRVQYPLTGPDFIEADALKAMNPRTPVKVTLDFGVEIGTARVLSITKDNIELEIELYQEAAVNPGQVVSGGEPELLDPSVCSVCGGTPDAPGNVRETDGRSFFFDQLVVCTDGYHRRVRVIDITDEGVTDDG